jgi:hypothetical protein
VCWFTNTEQKFNLFNIIILIMKITHEQIIKLVKQYPNDAALGGAIRELVIKSQNANEVYKDPAQINLLDSINEVTQNNGGIRL